MSDTDVRTNSTNHMVTEVQKVVNRKRKTSESDHLSSSVVADKIPRREYSSSNSDNVDNTIHVPSCSAVTIQELTAKANMIKKKGLFSEYESIRTEPSTGTFHASKLKANLSKNRYGDVLCFDHSRVILPCVGDDRILGYINANYCDGFKQKNAFICTQGPLPNTFTDFWRMVWHNQTNTIVMATRTVERSRTKCGQYWPNEKKSSKTFEEFIVYHNDSFENQNFTETQLMLQNTQTGECRQITHLQFTSWPDHGVPQARPFLDFLLRVRQIQEAATKEMGSSWVGHPLGPPIVVHCSAGIGRTGTFVTMDICLRQLEDVGLVDVKDTVRKIRSQRAFSIQVPDQYAFCYQAIIEYAEMRDRESSEKFVSIEDV